MILLAVFPEDRARAISASFTTIRPHRLTALEPRVYYPFGLPCLAPRAWVAKEWGVSRAGFLSRPTLTGATTPRPGASLRTSIASGMTRAERGPAFKCDYPAGEAQPHPNLRVCLRAPVFRALRGSACPCPNLEYRAQPERWKAGDDEGGDLRACRPVRRLRARYVDAARAAAVHAAVAPTDEASDGSSTTDSGYVS